MPLKLPAAAFIWISIAVLGFFALLTALCQNPEEPYHIAAAVLLTVLYLALIFKLLFTRQSLEHTRRNFDEAQQLAGIGSWERDLASGRGFWSNNLYRLFGLTPGAKVPTLEEFFLLIHPEDREAARSAVSLALERGGCYEMTYRRAADPEDHIFRSRGAVERDLDGSPLRIIGSVQDITERCRQQQLRDELLTQKELFITRLSHDLKTPLTPLMALLPLIRRNACDKGQHELIELCINSVQYIHELVRKTTRLAELSSSGGLKAGADVPLAGAVENSLKNFAGQQASCPAIDNRIPSDISVHADPTELEEVFRNLLSNAVKFSPHGAEIVIDAYRRREEITVSVRDNGIGLARGESEYIFDEFFKADQSRHELNSSGLGLSICRKIIERHGGKIWAESGGTERGTTICFTLIAGGTP